MARMRFEIKTDSGGISLLTYNTATFKFLQILREIDGAISGKSGGMVSWYIVDVDKNGTLALDIESRLNRPPKRPRQQIRDTAPAVAQSFVTGFENIEHRGISPPYLSEFGLAKLQDMMSLLHGDGARGFVATALDEKRSVAVTEKAADTLRKLLPSRREAEGSIEGMLETVSVHKVPKIVVYESLTRKGVTCLIAGDEMMKEATENLGKKVLVSGKVFFNIKEEPVRIAVRSLRVLGIRKKPPTVAEFKGSDPNFTGDMSTDEYIRSVRRG